MEEELKTLVLFRFGKARNCLNLARQLFEDCEYGFALNRAYYAVFEAMRAVNAIDGFDSSKHSGVISHFNQYYVKDGTFSAGTAAVIKRAYMLREKSDYEDFFEPVQNDVEEIIESVADVLNEVEHFLNQKRLI